MKKDYDTKDAKGTVQHTEMYDEDIAEMSLPDMLKSLSFDKKVVITAVVMFFMGRAWIPGGLLPLIKKAEPRLRKSVIAARIL